MEEVELRIPRFVQPPNIFYVYYDDDGNLISITNEKKQVGNYVEKLFDDVKDFLNGDKQLTNFQIKIINGSTKISKKIESRPVYKDLIVIDDCLSADLTVMINEGVLTFKLHDNIVSNQDNRNFKFYIVDKQNLNFLLKTCTVSFNDLKVGKRVMFKFDRYRHRIVTKKVFDTYGIIHG